jgi:putative component of membrane protein insertase Oxa1/YidC/SpoIIIJ protein YidD
MRRLALSLIHAYQRWISPHKGFACAHRVHLGGPSCSTVGARLIRRFGLRKGLPVLRLRLQRCGDVHRLHHPRWTRPLAAQRGDCDLPCDLPCDGGDAPSGRSAWRCLVRWCPRSRQQDRRGGRREITQPMGSLASLAAASAVHHALWAVGAATAPAALRLSARPRC